MKLRPLFARVLLRREKFEKSGSIIIPHDQQKRYSSTRCEVLALGPNADESIKIGDIVLLGQHAGAWINAEGNPASDNDEEEFYICMDEDILCVVEDERIAA